MPRTDSALSFTAIDSDEGRSDVTDSPPSSPCSPRRTSWDKMIPRSRPKDLTPKNVVPSQIICDFAGILTSGDDIPETQEELEKERGIGCEFITVQLQALQSFLKDQKKREELKVCMNRTSSRPEIRKKRILWTETLTSMFPRFSPNEKQDLQNTVKRLLDARRYLTARQRSLFPQD